MRDKEEVVKILRQIADKLEEGDYQINFEMENFAHEFSREHIHKPTGWNIYGRKWSITTIPPIIV